MQSNQEQVPLSGCDLMTQALTKQDAVEQVWIHFNYLIDMNTNLFFNI